MLKVFGKFGFTPAPRRDPQTVHLVLKLGEKHFRRDITGRPGPERSVGAHRGVEGRKTLHVRHGSSGLPQTQGRAPIGAIPGLIPAYEAAAISRCVAPLAFQVIAPSCKIEPDDRVVGTMALRLGFIAKWRKALRYRAMSCARNNGQKRSGETVEAQSHAAPISLSSGQCPAAIVLPVLSTPFR